MSRALLLSDNGSLFIVNCSLITYDVIHHIHNIKQLLDEVFVICGIINVKVKFISRAQDEADNSYRDINNFAYGKNRVH